MEFSKEFIEQHGLSDEQVKAVDALVEKEYIPTLKKDWDGAANKSAESILNGAAKYASEKAGVTLEREQGEKFGDFFSRLTDTALGNAKTDLANKQKELDEKLKNFKGGEEYKQQLETLKSEKDGLLQKVAKLEKLEGLDEKYETAQKELNGLKLRVAFNSVKPSFPDTVNEYEAAAKWGEFMNGVLEKYTIEIDGDKPVAVSKENEYSVVPLKDLVGADETLKGLLEGRQQKGTGGKPADFTEVKGVPFKVKKDATTEEISAQVREHLVEKLGTPTHPEFATKFSELFDKITNPTE